MGNACPLYLPLQEMHACHAAPMQGLLDGTLSAELRQCAVPMQLTVFK